jgi:hypothetical protein
MSNNIALKTEHYEFEIKVSERKYGDIVISKYFHLGSNENPCLSFILYTKEAQEILGKDIIYTANLMNIERLKECIINDISDDFFDTYSSNIELLNAFIEYIKLNYPYIKNIKLNDSSYIPCRTDDTLDLLSYSIALYGKTWYEIKYNAYIKNDKKYLEQTKKYVSKKFKSSIDWNDFYNKFVILANDTIYNKMKDYKELYEKSHTFPDFFKHIQKNLQKKDKCKFFKTWLEEFIKKHIDIHREWYIPLQQSGGKRKTRKIRN